MTKMNLGFAPSKPKSKKEDLEERIQQFAGQEEESTPEPAEVEVTPIVAPLVQEKTTVYQKVSGGAEYRATVYIPVELHTLLKLYCSMEKVSMSKYITELIAKDLGGIGPIDDIPSFVAAWSSRQNDMSS